MKKQYSSSSSSSGKNNKWNTLKMDNIPKEITLKSIIQYLNRDGYRGKYDFLYMLS